jgi:hypothetical protein
MCVHACVSAQRQARPRDSVSHAVYIVPEIVSVAAWVGATTNPDGGRDLVGNGLHVRPRPLTSGVLVSEVAYACLTVFNYLVLTQARFRIRDLIKNLAFLITLLTIV